MISPRFGPGDGGLLIIVLNHSSATWVSSRQTIASNPAASSAARVSASVNKKLVEASRAHGNG